MIRYRLIAGIIRTINAKINELEELHLDFADFAELNTKDILRNVGIDVNLSQEELSLLTSELIKVAHELQTREIVTLYAV